MADQGGEGAGAVEAERAPRVPPRWFVRGAWMVHRGLYRVTGGRFGLRRPAPNRYGILRLTTVGRRTGKERSVIVAYREDGPNLALVAMNGWAEPDPAWWLNLQAHPDASVMLPDGPRSVVARRATDDERARLWLSFFGANGDAYAALRSRETPILILEPRP
ncbi:MAG: nitroreductase family deazaflavin-dependent oxidoreductase [Dehalococcoidia bacterium]|nr:nitroreductase family deazaflavin-dependent oxidoreductase [Dehalococcoidia bacterium]